MILLDVVVRSGALVQFVILDYLAGVRWRDDQWRFKLFALAMSSRQLFYGYYSLPGDVILRARLQALAQIGVSVLLWRLGF